MLCGWFIACPTLFGEKPDFGNMTYAVLGGNIYSFEQNATTDALVHQIFGPTV